MQAGGATDRTTDPLITGWLARPLEPQLPTGEAGEQYKGTQNYHKDKKQDDQKQNDCKESQDNHRDRQNDHKETKQPQTYKELLAATKRGKKMQND